MKQWFAPTLKGYKKSYLLSDIIAGLIVAALSIPISMGYAQIAGLPAHYGLYGSVVPILLFAFLSTSPQFIIGVDAAPAALVGGTLASMGILAGSEEALQIVPVLTLCTGIFLVIFSVLGVGKLVKYISMPVMGGFISGISFTIILMQVPKLMGHGTVTGELFQLLSGIFAVAGEINWVSLILGIGTVIILLISKKMIPKFPMSVIAMIIGVCLTVCFHIDERYGVALLAEVESGLPSIHIFQFWDWDYLLIFESAFSIAVVITAGSLLASNNFANKNGYTIDKNREILGYGIGNIGSALIGGCPINGSVSRTSMTEQYGSKSQMTSIVAAIGMLFLLLFGTGFIGYLPVPILTGIVMAALIGVMEWTLAKRLFQESKVELGIFLGAFLGVLIFGTIAGVLIGICLSFVDVLIRTTNSPRSFLGVIPGKSGFHCLERSSGAHKIKHAVLYRFSGNLFFANISTFEQDIFQSIQPDTRYMIVDASGINDIDMTAADMLVSIYKRLYERNIAFFITEHTGNVNDKLRQYGAGELVEKGVARRTIAAALRDVHIYPPYDLEGNTKEHMEYAMHPDNRSLNEFEWAYGEEAARYMEAYAEEVLHHLSEVDDDTLSKGWYLEKDDLKPWRKLGHADEEMLLYYLELHIHDTVNQLGEKEILYMEEQFEKRRAIITKRLKEENKEEFEQLKEKFTRFEARMKQEHPKIYQEIIEARKHIQQEN